jgi:TM2 domain-containing membrane protein YozV
MNKNTEVDESVRDYLKSQEGKTDKNKKTIQHIEPSAVYVLAGFCSFIFPGLGQLLLNRILGAALCFVSAVLWWIVMLNFIQEAGSFITVAILITITIIPNIVSAYLAANGD